MILVKQLMNDLQKIEKLLKLRSNIQEFTEFTVDKDHHDVFQKYLTTQDLPERCLPDLIKYTNHCKECFWNSYETWLVSQGLTSYIKDLYRFFACVGVQPFICNEETHSIYTCEMASVSQKEKNKVIIKAITTMYANAHLEHNVLNFVQLVNMTHP